MFDLSSELNRESLAARIGDEVNAACAEHFKDESRTHLGASILGDECSYRLWARWRWLKNERFSGRMQRLFDRGHKEEPRMIQWLEMIGFTVFDVDPNTGKQFRITGCDGHFGGSADTFAYAPARFGLSDPLLVEFKTYNDKWFTMLAGKCLQKTPEYKRDATKAKRVRGTHPKHYTQMCSYGRAYNVGYALYCAVNKDTDELYYEIVPLNADEGDDMFRKAETVVYSQTPLPRLASTPTYFECKMCNLVGVCHMQHAPDKNCRSCINARPVANKEWSCLVYGIIPKDFIPKGCDDWKSIV